jgi:hypothetical protein
VFALLGAAYIGTMRAFLLRSHDGEEEAGSASVVEGRCEKLKGSGESETLWASGGEEAASDPWRSCAKSYETGGEIHIHHSKAAVEAQLATGKFATDSKAPWLRVRKGEVHAPNVTTWASNIVASADTRVSHTVANARTRMFGPVRKRNRTVKRSGIGWTANGAGWRKEAVVAGPQRGMVSRMSANARTGVRAGPQRSMDSVASRRSVAAKVAPLARRCRVSIGTCEQPGQTKKGKHPIYKECRESESSRSRCRRPILQRRGSS